MLEIRDLVPTFVRFVLISFSKIFKNYFLTWISFENCIDIMKDRLTETNYAPTVIIGISGGGLIVADLLGKKYSRKIPVLSLPYDRVRDASTIQIKIPCDLFSFNLGGHKVLLVDDCTITGSVLSHMQAYLNNLGEDKKPKEIKTFVVGLIDDDSKHIIVQPDYYAIRIKRGFKFPWGTA